MGDTQVMEPIYRPIIAAGKVVTAVMNWKIDITGLEHLPTSGPAVVAANHISYLDPLPLLWAADRRGRFPRFMGKQSMFDLPVIGAMGRQMRHIPVQRDVAGSQAVDVATQRLGDGEIVVVYPEATISVSFVPMTLKPGAALLALATGAPLVPFVAFGAHRLSTKHQPQARWQRGVPILGAFGLPLAVDEGDTAAAVTDRLGEQMRAMLDEIVDRYPREPGDDGAWWMPAHLGGGARTIEEAEALRARESDARKGSG